MRQLTIYGGEVEFALIRSGLHVPRLTETQRRILDLVDVAGSIRSVQAGVLMHEARGHCGMGAKSTRRSIRERRSDRIACCPYANADGNEAMKRLEERGLVRRTFLRGRWVRP